MEITILEKDLIIKDLQFKNKKIECNNAKELKIKNFFDDSKRVPDVCRYFINKRNNIITVSDMNVIKESNYKDLRLDSWNNYSENGTIVLLLESPHIEEYTHNFVAIAPAQGITGDNIHNYLGKVINHKSCKSKLDDRNYRLIIANPIQYQMSLGHILKSLDSKTRDIVWKNVWKDEKLGLQKQFEDRISSYKPNLIINACTSKLKNYVKKAINANCEIVDIYHPVKWKMYKNDIGSMFK